MIIFIKKPDGNVLEIEVGPKAVGLECLDLTCLKLNLVEGDYFGLQFTAKKGERHWLNLRNTITSQLPIGFSQPIRLDLRVKFHVEPHILQQDITRHLFFHDAKLLVKEEKIKAALKDAARLAALFTQAEKGDFGASNDVELLAGYFPQFADSEEFKVTAQAEYARLRSMKVEHALLSLLREICEMDSYGLNTFTAKTCSGQLCEVGVGAHGILVTNIETQDCVKIPLSSVKRLSVEKRDCQMHYELDDGHNFTTDKMELTLHTKEIAEGLYRSITEKVEFFTSETVSEPVKDQFVRDFRGSIVSFFNINTDLGKKYSFDLRRTQQEVHDEARRKLFRMGISTQSADADLSSQAHNRQEGTNQLEQELQMFRDAVTCKVCMASHMDTVLLPCGHFLLCSNCAGMVSSCPSCRLDIEERKKIFWDRPMNVC
ncbi:E3 ubiquitin-protein ligase MYLIP-A [Strongylocentrotus purpuratus]|uniref:RING-type E3 ubiquitin transferase n=1 Tax=Strongylocentrotus purpuratus TaxID=7668 RepID=A0A7M7RD28_STRPU|nr:E3 ubiquitin-protein ligase MYLIP-A [Strongylocentrotus purpuratus]|eukprot:XP_790458.1 PREDICTED: E3 ubiquitin-protein ligase MYLIP-A [Strongylocentrotus purpuratus]